MSGFPQGSYGGNYGQQMQSPQPGMQSPQQGMQSPQQGMQPGMNPGLMGPNSNFDPTLPQGNYAPPIQNPPAGGMTGAADYSTGAYPQMTGGYWNQLSQLLAGPKYTSGTQPTQNVGGGIGNAQNAMTGSYPVRPRLQ